jgi:hypothetical protein
MRPALHRWLPAVLIAAALWAAAGAAGSALGRGGGAVDLVVLAVGLTAAGFLAIPLADGSSVPVGRALLLPLAASSPMAVFLVVVAAAQTAHLVLARAAGAPSGARRWAAGVAVAASAGAAYRLVAWLAPSGAWPALMACAAAVAVAASFDPAGDRAGTSRKGWSGDRLQVHVVVFATGALMVLGYGRPDGGRSLGLAGLALFAVPLLLAWWSFKRLDHMRRTSRQTIAALSTIAEHGGWAPAGHAAQVAASALLLGQELRLSATDLAAVEQAALLHDLGRVCLDDVDGRPPGPDQTAAAAARMLRRDPGLERAADLVEALAGGLADGSDPAVQVFLAAYKRHHDELPAAAPRLEPRIRATLAWTAGDDHLSPSPPSG